MLNLKQTIASSIAITIIIVLAVLLVGGTFAYQYYYATPKEETGVPKTEIPTTELPRDETANWRTYRNDKVGFEIKYPNGAQISFQEQFLHDEPGYLDYPKEIYKIDIGPLPVYTADTEDKKLKIIDTVKSGECPIMQSFTIKSERVNINNLEFSKKIGYDSECNLPLGGGYAGACYFDIDENGQITTGRFVKAYYSTRYYIRNNNSCFSFNFLISPAKILGADYEKEAEIFEQILSTFKFIN